MISEIFRNLSAYIDSLPLARPGDFRSHGQFAGVVLRELATLRGQDCSNDDLDRIVLGLIRRRDWYEYAVLYDLGIADGKGRMNPFCLRAWFAQAGVLKGSRIPYNGLLTIAYTWQAAGDEGFRLFMPAEVAGVSARPQPPMPRWMKLVSDDPADDDDDFREQILKLCCSCPDPTMFEVLHFDYTMACREPDLQLSRLPLLRDQYRDETVTGKEARVERYVAVVDEWVEEYERFLQELQARIRLGLERGKAWRAKNAKHGASWALAVEWMKRCDSE